MAIRLLDDDVGRSPGGTSPAGDAASFCTYCIVRTFFAVPEMNRGIELILLFQNRLKENVHEVVSPQPGLFLK